MFKYSKQITLFIVLVCGVILLNSIPAAAKIDSEKQMSVASAAVSNIALGKTVTITTNGANDAAIGAEQSPSDITDGSLAYEPASSLEGDGVIGYSNDDYAQLMEITVTIDLGGMYDISSIRYNMGDVQFAEDWNPDIMISPLGTTTTIPGGSYSGVWTEQTGNTTESSVEITFQKTRQTFYQDWLFIGEIEIYGVPASKVPIVFLPGITGSKLENDPDGDGEYDEVWPNSDRAAGDFNDSSWLVLALKYNGVDPLVPELDYTSVRVGDILLRELVVKDIYDSTVKYFTNNGYTEDMDFIVCPYDWRKGLDYNSFKNLNDHKNKNNLDSCIDEALTKNPNASQVNILAHSMGGMVARYYISDQTRAQKVHRLVTLGTPYLGAPKMALAVIDEHCFVEWEFLCFTSAKTLKKLAVNFPSTYQLSPMDDYFQAYPNGYIRIDRDTNGDGKNEGYLDINKSFTRLGETNEYLAQNARSLLSSIGGWNNGETNGVEVFMLVGDGIGTIGTIVEYNKSFLELPIGFGVAYKTEMINGDGTVPLNSATMRGLSNDAYVFYTNIGHGDLPINQTVLTAVDAIFNTPTNMITNKLNISDNIAIQQNETLEGLRTEPIPLNGRFITLDGPTSVEVVDNLGNRIGAINDGNGYEVSIPGASFYELSNSISIFLPDNNLYDLTVYGEQEAATDIRIQKIVSDQLTETALYDDLPLTSNSRASLEYDPNASAPGSFDLDQDGDGTNEATFTYTEILDAIESEDTVSPKTTIDISGTPSPDGWYIGEATVTMNATDNVDGTGIAKIEYTLDEGASVQIYSGPFTINANETQTIYAKATDRAGNEEYPFSFAGLLKVYLPTITK